MKSIISILLLLPGFMSFVSGQSSVKGYKSLGKNDYVKANEVFLKYFSQDTANSAINLGLALLYSNNDFPAHDYFKAWDYIQVANRNFNKLSDDEIQSIRQYYTIVDMHLRDRPARYDYDLTLKHIENLLIKFVREENSVEIAEHFMKAYPTSKYYENVVDIRNHLEFRLAQKANTLEAYQSFVHNYPNAAQIPMAIEACQKLAFQEARKKNTIEAYNAYMKAYPKADQYFSALKLRNELAFNVAKNVNTIEALENYINTYPKSRNVMNARSILRKLLYLRAKQVSTLEAYDDFITQYPDGEYFVDIFNLKANVLGKQIIQVVQGDKTSISWAKGFDFEGNNDIAGGIAVANDGTVFLAGTRQRSGGKGTQCWLISLDKSGKVLWNKALGSHAFNQTYRLQFAPDSNLLVTGWSGSFEDTTFRKAWIMKVTRKGQGLWEKNEGGNEIKNFIKSPEGSFYLSGYTQGDSSRIHPFLEKLNRDYKMIWSRSYTHQGALGGIILNSKDEVEGAAGRWIFKLTPQGYIHWEKLLPAGDSILFPAYFDKYLFLCGIRDTLPLITRLTDANKEIADITLPQSDSFYVPTGFLYLPDCSEVVLTTNYKDLKLSILDNNGREVHSLFFPGCVVSGPQSLTSDAQGNIYVTISITDSSMKSDIGILKLTM